MRVCSPSRKRIPNKMITTVFAFQHRFQTLSLISIFLTRSKSKHNIHKSWINHKGQVPLRVQRKYFTIHGSPKVKSVPCTTAETWVLKYPVIRWKTNSPIVAGTSSLRLRALNHSLPECFCNAYLALIPANKNSKGINRGYKIYMTISWYCCISGKVPNPPIPPNTPLLLKK